MGKRWLIFFIIFVSLPVNLIAQNFILFFEEHIDFRLDNDNFSINGIFSFYNNSNEIVNQKIIFPFAAKINMIDSIRIIDLRSFKLIPYIRMSNAISFDLSLLPKDTLDINVYYRQKTSYKNTYIITTTKLWGKSLDKAIYTLTTPKDMAINSFSYAPDTMRIIDEKKIYTWNKYHFSPQEDFDIVTDKIK